MIDINKLENSDLMIENNNLKEKIAQLERQLKDITIEVNISINFLVIE